MSADGCQGNGKAQPAASAAAGESGGGGGPAVAWIGPRPGPGASGGRRLGRSPPPSSSQSGRVFWPRGPGGEGGWEGGGGPGASRARPPRLPLGARAADPFRLALARLSLFPALARRSGGWPAAGAGGAEPGTAALSAAGRAPAVEEPGSGTSPAGGEGRLPGGGGAGPAGGAPCPGDLALPCGHEGSLGWEASQWVPSAMRASRNGPRTDLCV